MEKEICKSVAATNETFRLLVEQARKGDNGALEKVLEELEPHMEHLASFIKMPREDSLQEMKTRFIEVIRGQ
ncbi:Helix-turn-helix domain-containing protein [Anaerovirgula multivorans]|uniref:Helix-turn-helix domain-containing protein n=1 Tax=Anaerovirgula multivorans TaxID=312168 RepID=A0A239KZN0_9FIRM|nr:helix-turn-helix domain-containing protein [Anaerovirgula multivorans]SNT22744.1 Helix-turn-helix domain-containing protein [Anaerovirgula multivorans]